MRFGPATRTAFACVNSPLPLRATRQLSQRSLIGKTKERFYWPTLSSGGASHLSAMQPDRACWLQFRYAEPFSEEAATPGLPATLARFGNRSAVHPRKLPQNQLAQSLAA
jgi:hypothetical protein